MRFSEKLSKLLALTEMSGARLAKAVGLDTTQVSRMKTGARGRPGSAETLRRIANGFAARCDSEYRLSALAELTGDTRLWTHRSEHMAADVIFEWLCTDNGQEEPTKLGAFLKRADGFSVRGLPREAGASGEAAAKGSENAFIAYYDNHGKRRAVLDLLARVGEGGEPGEVYLFSDEHTAWAYEDAAFVRELAEAIQSLAQRGCIFHRVEPPTQDLSVTLRSIERWLPAYMLGAVRQYHYPRARDELHRRTLFVAPGRSAVFSRSLAGQTQSRLTMYCEDETMVELCHQEALDILHLCRPMMRAYTAAEADEAFRCVLGILSLPADGIYKTAALSIPTLPVEIMERVFRENGSALAKMLLDSQHKYVAHRAEILREYQIIDIMSLADEEDVRGGRVPIPSTRMLPGGAIYYTAAEYRLHLQRIVEGMVENDNYQVVLIDDPRMKHIVLYCKGTDRAIMIKDADPCTVFEITEGRLAASFWDFLKRLADYERSRTDRRRTLMKLRAAMARLDGEA